jgi:thermitase
MKAIFTLLLVAIGHTLCAQNTQRFVSNHLLIKIKPEYYDASKIDLQQHRSGVSSLEILGNQYGMTRMEQIGQHKITRTFLLEFSQAIDVADVALKYNRLGVLDFAEPDYIAMGGGEKAEIIPNDTRFNKQWGLYNPGTQTAIGNVVADADVDMELAWDIETGDPNMTIAVSDSGLRMTHPDIAARIWTNTAETVNGIDDDGNGLIDDVNGWDWANNDNLPSDDLGHGTNVAGIIGAIPNNNNLFTGANWNSKIMVLKVLDAANSATYSAMANSIYYAVDKGAKVFSMSIGGAQAQIMDDAVTYADTHNVVFAACMMNFNNDVSYYPAAYSLTHSNVIAVGSTNPDDTRTVPFFWSTTSGSNYGSHLNVVAPGNYIFSLSHTSDTSSTVYWGGTSQATPLVAAIASLILAHDPTLTPAQVRALIQDSAQDQVGNPTEDVAGFDQYMGHGRANAFAALTLLAKNEVSGIQPQEFRLINPETNGTLQLFSKGQYPGEYEMMVYSIDGKLLHTETVNVNGGLNTFSFVYPQGNYILTLKSERYTKIFKVVKD